MTAKNTEQRNLITSSFDAVAEQRQIASQFLDSPNKPHGSYVPPGVCWICLERIKEENQGDSEDTCSECELEFPIKTK